MSNFIINIFQEQFNLIDNLPDNEKKEVLYFLIQSRFNQLDCCEKQSTLSTSTSTSLSKLSLSVIDIISKTMKVREMKENHGGARKGAGAPKGNNNANKNEKQSKNNQDSIKLIDLPKNNKQITIPEWLLRTDNYDDLTDLQRKIYDTPEMRTLLNAFWGGKQSVKPLIGELYLKLIEQRMKIKPRTSKFKKPTEIEVKEYCKERKNTVDADKFINYYESNGWKVGKNSMKDWKAAVRNWEKSKFNTNMNSKNLYLEQDTENTFLKKETNYGD